MRYTSFTDYNADDYYVKSICPSGGHGRGHRLALQNRAAARHVPLTVKQWPCSGLISRLTWPHSAVDVPRTVEERNGYEDGHELGASLQPISEPTPSKVAIDAMQGHVCGKGKGGCGKGKAVAKAAKALEGVGRGAHASAARRAPCTTALYTSPRAGPRRQTHVIRLMV